MLGLETIDRVFLDLKGARLSEAHVGGRREAPFGVAWTRSTALIPCPAAKPLCGLILRCRALQSPADVSLPCCEPACLSHAASRASGPQRAP